MILIERVGKERTVYLACMKGWSMVYNLKTCSSHSNMLVKHHLIQCWSVLDATLLGLFELYMFDQ
jgi:hypothetical protein